jgi:hypothetical protein
MKGVQIKTMIEDILLIKYDENDVFLPRRVCYTCLNAVRRVMKLREIALESDEYFRSKLIYAEVQADDDNFVKCDQVNSQANKEPEIDINDYENDWSFFLEPTASERREQVSIRVNEIFDFDKLPYGKKIRIEAGRLGQPVYKISHPDPLPQFPFKCFHCPKRFETKEGIRRHIKIHLSEETKEDEIIKKLSVSEIIKSNFSEAQREKMIKKKLNLMLEANEKSHKTVENEVKCYQCQDKFFTMQELNFHVAEKHKNLIRKLDEDELEYVFKCCDCKTIFDNIQKLENHLKSHESNDSFSCKMFPKTRLKNFEEFCAHVRKHVKPKTHMCLKCLKRGHLDNKFKKHIYSHESVQFKFKCKLCVNVKFRHRYELEEHNVKKHDKVRESEVEDDVMVLCSVCAELVQENKLKFHMRKEHGEGEKEKKFQCKVQFCMKKFQKSESLLKHETCHTIERTCCCEVDIYLKN